MCFSLSRDPRFCAYSTNIHIIWLFIWHHICTHGITAYIFFYTNSIKQFIHTLFIYNTCFYFTIHLNNSNIWQYFVCNRTTQDSKYNRFYLREPQEWRTWYQTKRQQIQQIPSARASRVKSKVPDQETANTTDYICESLKSEDHGTRPL